MFYLHTSNRTENLLSHLSNIIEINERRSVFEKELILIQSQGMERIISQTMADYFGSWCNFEYHLPLDFLHLISQKIDLEFTADGFNRESLVWRIEYLLRHVDDDLFLPLKQYLSGQNVNVKRFQLARQLANMFDQYQLLRADMLASWEQGKTVLEHQSEPWQLALWNKLVLQLEGNLHRGELLQRVNEKLNGAESLTDVLPQRVSVFGLHIMPPLFLECLAGLANHIDVHLYVLSPCEHYWGDIESKRGVLKKQLLQPNQEENPTTLQDDYHPLLTALGQQGRSFQEMLLRNVDFTMEFESPYDPLASEGETVLLHQLQSDLLHGKVTIDSQSVSFQDDDSIRVISCHSRLREMMILKDHLLQMLYDQDELELRDIVVMAPDIQEYGPLISAVFHDIQHSVADRSLRKRNNVFGAFTDFLQLFKGRFGWGEVTDVLKNEAVHPTFELTSTDLDNIQHWITSSGIRWGLSGKQRKEDGLPDIEENSWKSGLERMLFGYAMCSTSQVEGVFPFEQIEGSSACALGGLCQFVEIIERTNSLFKIERTIEQWVPILLDISESIFGDGDSRELLELRTTLVDLQETVEGFHDAPVHFDVMFAWFEQAAQETRSNSGFLRGQLTFCSMLPMRSIPFEVVCLVGLNDGEFPKKDHHATFDLVGVQPRLGDRSARADDRYQFLEAILAARQCLYLSHVGQSIRSNDSIPPSVVITELLEVIDNSYGVKDLVVAHPLQPFNQDYFSNENSKLFSYNQGYCGVANSLKAGRKEAGKWWQGNLSEHPKTISFQELLTFYRNPQCWFVRECLDIRFDSFTEIPEERESFISNPLDSYLIQQDLFQSYLENKPNEDTKTRLVAEGRWPLAEPGKLAFDEISLQQEQFADEILAYNLGEKLPDVNLDIVVGEYRIVGTLSNVYENGILLARYAKCKGKDLLVAWLHHLVAQCVSEINPTTVLVTSDTQFSLQAGQSETFLLEFETIIAHFLDGCRQPSEFYVEAALAMLDQKNKPRAKIAPVQKAIDTLSSQIESGYEPELALLLQGFNVEELINQNFEDLSETLLGPVWRVANAK